MTVDIRIVNPDGTLGEVLPEYETLEYQDTPDDVGAVAMAYRPDGLRADLIQAKQEFALVLDGLELPNSRFRFDQSQGDPIRDTMGNIVWAGQTLLARLDEAVVAPLTDPTARQNVLTPEEQAAYAEAVSAAQAQWQKDRDEALAQWRTDVTAWQKAGSKGLEPAKPEPTIFAEELEGLLDSRLTSAPPPVSPFFDKATPGKVVLDLFRAAQDRGSVEEVTVSFTATHDSKGTPWPKTITQRFDVGQSILAVCKWLTENRYAEARMVGRRFDLYAFNDDGLYTGNDLTSRGVMLAFGKNLKDGPRTQDYREMVNALFAVSDAGVHGWVTDEERIRRDGRIEGVFTGTGQKTWTELEAAARQVIDSYGDGKEERTYGLTGLDVVPYVDFTVGDLILVLEGEYPEPMVVKAITLSVDSSGDIQWAVTLNDRILDDVEKTALRVQSMIGNTGATMGGAGLLTYQQPGMFADGSAPNPPSPPIVVTGSGSAQFSYDGTDASGDPALWDQDHVELHISTDPDFVPDSSTLFEQYVYGSTTLPNLPYSLPLYAKFVAVDAGGDWSSASEGVEFVVLPPTSGTDGNPPGSAPTVTVYAGLGTLHITWTQITNNDLAWYRVYVSTTPSFTPAPENEVHVGPETSYTLRNLGGSMLDYATTYYVRVKAEDEDGLGPASDEASGSPQQVTSPDIAANQGWFGYMSVENLRGGVLGADRVEVGGKVTTRPSDTGAGVELSLEGLYLFGPDGLPRVILPSDLAPGNPAVFKGDGEFETLSASGFTLRGTTNEFEVGAGAVLASGVTSPTSPPTLVADWYSVSAGIDTSTYGNPVGMWWRSDLGGGAGRWEVATWKTPTSYANGGFFMHYLFADGTLDSTNTVQMGSHTVGDYGVAATSFESGGVRRWYVMRDPANYDERVDCYTWTGSAWSLSGSFTYDRIRPGEWSTLGTDGTYLVVWEYDHANSRWRGDKRNTTSPWAHVSYTYLTGAGWGQLRSVLYGTFGSNFGGASRYVALSSNVNAKWIAVHDGSSFHSDDEWPKAGAVGSGFLGWDGTNFWELNNLRLYRYENGNLLADTSEQTQTWWGGFTWRDTNATGGTHETACVNASQVTMARRKRLVVTTSPLPPPPDPATSDDVNAVAVYLGKGASKPANTALWLQGVSGTELCTNGDFETNTANWESNTAFGAYQVSSLSRSATRAHKNTYSLLVTMPALTAVQRTWANHYPVPFLSGATYKMQAWVYVPTGSPNVKWDVVFYGTQPDADAVATKDAWVELVWYYTNNGTAGMRFPGICTVAGSSYTAGQTFYIDDVRITPVDVAQPVEVTDATFSGTNPPSSSSFGASNPAAFESGATDSGGALWHVHGDGSGRWGPFEFASDGTVVSAIMADRCRVRRTSDTAVGTGDAGSYTISWQAEDYDPNGMWSSGTDITIAHAGMYAVTAGVQWQNPGTACDRNINICINGNYKATDHAALHSGTGNELSNCSPTWVGYLAANDVVTVDCWQNSGGNLNIEYTASATTLGTYCAVTRLW